jgi:hypothetical protein
MAVKKMLAVVLLSGFFSFLFPGMGRGCDYCLVFQGASPLDVVKGKGVRLTQRYTSLESVYSGSEEVSNPGAGEEYWTTELSGFYGLTERLVVMAIVPIRKTALEGHLHVHEDGAVEAEDVSGGAFGLGDVTLLARYTAFERHTLGATTAVAGLLGVKLPTGSTDEMTDDGAEYLDAHLQAGTGSTDMVLGLSASHAMGRLTLSTNLLGSIPTEGEAGGIPHRYGNTLNYDATARYRASGAGTDSPGGSASIYLSMGLNGELRGKEEEDGIEVANSGGNTVYLSPGAQVSIADHLVFELTYQHAVFHDLNGTQLGEDYRAAGGVTYLF